MAAGAPVYRIGLAALERFKLQPKKRKNCF